MSEQIHGLRRWFATIAGCLALAVVVTAPAVASWRGLMSAGHDWLALPGWWAALVPLVLDSAALYVATLALRATLRGDSARMDRLLVWAYVAISAGLNVAHAEVIGGTPAALFYGVASGSALVLYERTLRALNRDRLYERGEIDAPAPRFRALRWLLWRAETWQAFRLAVRDGVSDPREAIARARGELTAPAPTVSDGGMDYAALAGESKRQAIETAAAEIGSYEQQRVCDWLATEHGVIVDYSYTRKVLRNLAAQRRRELVQSVPTAVEG